MYIFGITSRKIRPVFAILIDNRFLMKKLISSSEILLKVYTEPVLIVHCRQYLRNDHFGGQLGGQQRKQTPFIWLLLKKYHVCTSLFLIYYQNVEVGFCLSFVSSSCTFGVPSNYSWRHWNFIENEAVIKPYYSFKVALLRMRSVDC